MADKKEKKVEKPTPPPTQIIQEGGYNLNMKNFILHPLTIIISLIITIFILFNKFTKKVTYKGKVLEHNIVSNKYGDIYYYTIASFEDGYVRSLSGFDYYIIPVGQTIYYTIRVIK